MMQTCDLCGAVDDLDNMFYITDTHGTTRCVCEGCRVLYSDPAPVTEIAKALSGSMPTE